MFSTKFLIFVALLFAFVVISTAEDGISSEVQEVPAEEVPKKTAKRGIYGGYGYGYPFRGYGYGGYYGGFGGYYPYYGGYGGYYGYPRFGGYGGYYPYYGYGGYDGYYY